MTMKRFVLLLHKVPQDFGRGTHFDLMLESEVGLMTWAIERIPRPAETIEAMKLPDHRVEYLDYEGPVSKNRGVVTRVDSGRFEYLQATSDRIDVAMFGTKLTGRASLRQVCGDNWLLTFYESDDDTD